VRELDPRLTKTTLHIALPEAQRSDLDHLAWVRLVAELRRIGAKCRSKGG
jgi:hypothetical protein